MAGALQPLDQKFAIVDKNGNPTRYFTEWAQQKQIDIGGSITLQDVIDYLTAHMLVPGVGIQFAPDGNINNSPTIHADVQAILDEITATRGAVLYRGLLGWAALLPGAAGQFLQTAGAGADPLWAAASGGGGGVSTIAHPGGLNGVESPAVNFYISRRVVAADNISINKVAFECSTASPTAKYQPFIYDCSPANVMGALKGSGVQVTGTVAGYNEAPLSAPAALIKGNFYLIGASVITHGIDNLYLAAAGGGFFVANGGSSVPASPAPGGWGGGSIYGFWGVV